MTWWGSPAIHAARSVYILHQLLSCLLGMLLARTHPLPQLPQHAGQANRYDSPAIHAAPSVYILYQLLSCLLGNDLCRLAALAQACHQHLKLGSLYME